MNEHLELVRKWFTDRQITNAVVGYSGGIDSATTAALLRNAGVEVTLVVAEAPNQRYSSPMGGVAGASKFAGRFSCGLWEIDFDYPNLIKNIAREAALPILRNACFYGVAADLNARGLKTVVAGTTNFSEAAFLGFWGKASDGAQDVYPISHLSKREVFTLAYEFGVPEKIITAVPSGDLLFEQTNDAEMIGATYPQIDAMIEVLRENVSQELLEALMHNVSDPKKFATNIVRNAFKYELPFPGFHVSDRLEQFRLDHYPNVLKVAQCMI